MDFLCQRPTAQEHPVRLWRALAGRCRFLSGLLVVLSSAFCLVERGTGRFGQGAHSFSLYASALPNRRRRPVARGTGAMDRAEHKGFGFASSLLGFFFPSLSLSFLSGFYSPGAPRLVDDPVFDRGHFSSGKAPVPIAPTGIAGTLRPHRSGVLSNPLEKRRTFGCRSR